MKKRAISLLMTLMMLVIMAPAVTLTADAASAPTKVWLEPSETNGIPAPIDVFVSQKSGSTYTAELYLPGNAVPGACFLSWDNDSTVTVDGESYDSGGCPIPPVGTQKTYAFKNGNTTLVTYKITSYQGSTGVVPVFIEINESAEAQAEGYGTIAQMDAEQEKHNVKCKGQIFIDGTSYVLDEMKGRGNASWKESKDKKPYNIKLKDKINFPGISTPAKTKKWSLLAEVLDRSLLCNRSGYHLAYELGIGQDTTSADVWMNGEYQGCYTVTAKTDSFVTDDGYMIEQDNYKEDPVSQGGDPQFTLEGLKEASGWSSCYNRITVKEMGDNLLLKDGVVDESTANIEDVAYNKIKPWLQDAWDAIRSSTGYNSKGKYYTDYIDIESFAKMYLMHEYVKSYDVCAGSILYHRDGNTDDYKLIAGPLWDLDNAMGSVYQNASLGKADSRKSGEGDRRSAQGDFIQNVTEYKTSIYKTISKHSDFMAEVKYQYTKNRAAFDSLAADTQNMIESIDESARMNHIKVQDLGNGQGKNNHYYGSQTTLGSNPYSQTYVATTSWSKYAANLKTYIATRSLWFSNNYVDPSYVDPADCTHEYQETRVEPTCTSEGYVTYRCPICRHTYTETLAKLPHDYHEGVCTVCGEHLITASISCDEGASVTVYEKKGIDSPHVENAVSANPRDGDTGLIDCSGDGQINLVVNLKPCYELVSITAEPSGSYNNIKGPTDTDIENGYRFTKVGGDLTINVTTRRAHVLTAHEAVDATCTEAGNSAYWSCSECGKYFSDEEGETEIEEGSWVIADTGHDWGDATYRWAEDNKSVTATRVCAHDASHIETDTAEAIYAVTTAPTCTEAGVGTWTSAAFENEAFSAQTKTVVIDATGHTPVIDAAVAPTCTENGLTEGSHCSVCNEVLVAQEVVPATGHDWGKPAYEWATDNKSVTATRVCAHDESHVETETAEATYEVTTAPTCTEAGVGTWTSAAFENEAFSVQTKTVSITATGHTPVVDAAVAPTCTETGLTEGSHCSVCGDVLVAQEVVPALGHTPVVDAAVAPTCTETGLTEGKHCSVCNEVLVAQEVVPATGHKWGEAAYKWAEDNKSVTATRVCVHDESHVETETAAATYAVTTEPTCTETGVGTWTSAAFENEAFSAQTKMVDIAATGHTPVVDAAVAPTCTETGLTEGSHCSVCGDVLVAQEVVPALGHTPVVDAAVAPTCTETGLTEGKHCSVCNEVLVAQEVVPALGHDWGDAAYKWAEDNKSVTATRVCAHDASHVETETSAATYAVTTEPTCTKAGVGTWTSAAFENEAFSAQTKTVDIAATGHTPVVDAAVEPTCTETGLTEGSHCSVCKEVLVAQEVVPALGHTEVIDEAVAPTCTETGLTEGSHCSVCKEVLVAQEVVPALGHDYQLVEGSAVEATCTEDGHEADQKCSRCGDVIPGEVIKATGHSFGEWEEYIPSTCEGAGTIRRICKTCGLTESQETDPTGHDFEDEFTVDKEATCTEDGSRSRHCKNCEVTIDSEVIPATGHSYGKWATVKAATCLEDGREERVCEKCGNIETAAIPAVGHHSYDEGKVTKAPSTDEEGVMTYTCTACGDSYEITIPKLEKEQAEASEAVETADSAAAIAEQAVEKITEDSADDSIAEADRLAEDAVSDAEEAEKKAEEAYEKAVEEYGEDSGAAAYAQTLVDNAKELKAKALVSSAAVKKTSAKVAGNKAVQAKDAAAEAAATPGDAAIAAAQEAETLAVKAAEEAGIAVDVAKEAFEAVKDAYGDDPGTQQYQEAEKMLNDAVAFKANADIAAAEATKAVEEARKAKEDAEEPEEKKGRDGTDVGPGASYSVAERAIINSSSEAGPAGTRYSLLKLRSTKQAKSSITIRWNRASKAKKYVIFGSKCGKTNKMKKLAVVSGSTKVIGKIGKTSLKKGTYYKFIVVALDENDTVVSTSKVIHVATKGGKYGNHKSVAVEKKVLNKAKKMKVGKSLKLNAKTKKASGTKVKIHRSLRYESSNTKVAVVSKSGTIKAKGKGTCYINAYAQNGVYKRVKVVVK